MNSSKLGVKGFRSVAQLLQKEGSSLRCLDLTSTDMDDDMAVIVADSLKCNTLLESLYMGGNNNISERGCRAFLKLLNDVSSIESTYSSNHTLTQFLWGYEFNEERHRAFFRLESGLSLSLPNSTDATVKEMKTYIDLAVDINRKNGGKSHAAGRAKVIGKSIEQQQTNGTLSSAGRQILLWQHF